VACQSDKGGKITTGGGFSRAYAAPPWQSEVASAYLEAFEQGDWGDRISAKGYPRGMRGYPDVSLMAHNYVIAAAGKFQPGETVHHMPQER
jgi:hypothetical protein